MQCASWFQAAGILAAARILEILDFQFSRTGIRVLNHVNTLDDEA